MNIAVFGKAMEIERKHRYIKLAATERKRNYLITKPNYHTTKFFTEDLLAIEMKKAEILVNKPVCLGLSRLQLCKLLICKFWYDYVKPKYDEKAILCYIDTNSFIVYIKTDSIYKDIAENVETRFYNSNYELDRLCPKRKKKNVIELMKAQLGGKFMTKFVGLRAKTYYHLSDDGCGDKKAKGTKKYVIRRKRKFGNYKNFLEVTQIQNKINYLEK